MTFLAAVAIMFGAAAALGALDTGEVTGPSAPGPVTSAPTDASTVTSATAPTTTSTTEPVPEPAADVAALADRTTMTPQARRIFYAAEPVLVDKAGLGSACDLRAEVSVLGCFASGEITVLRVEDPRLDGMMETTAAHEMLHAVWAQRSAAERDELIPLLRTAYDALDDPRVRDKVETYRRDDPDVVDNELHSILGTEVADLPDELGRYYGQWFTDRAAVVALAASSQATFAAIEDEVDALDADLAARSAAIGEAQAALDARRVELDALDAELERLRAAGEVAAYNQLVDTYNAGAAAYNAEADRVRAAIDDYNAIVARRNALVEEWAALREPIDTSAADPVS
ncbi:MAG: hypothetical protein S0880_19610 [Actinomycetota bacterium]|nr:hypothetical protein [Actinomycetota bacterium]